MLTIPRSVSATESDSDDVDDTTSAVSAAIEYAVARILPRTLFLLSSVAYSRKQYQYSYS